MHFEWRNGSLSEEKDNVASLMRQLDEQEANERASFGLMTVRGDFPTLVMVDLPVL